MTPCRICTSNIDLIHDFGPMPLANGFLKKEDFAREYFFNLAIGFCPHCYMTQLIEQPPPEAMFHEAYPFFTGSSRKMIEHFSLLATFIQERIKSTDPFVIEIGSNDGTHLKNFALKNIRHLGIEPSQNVAQKAIENGVNTLSAFFNQTLASQIESLHGKADALVTTNVLCHIPDLIGFIKSCDQILKPDGFIIFEDPYLGDILQKTSYDQIYDEHVFYFSLTSVKNIFNQNGFELIEVHPQWTHGGSMRYVLARTGQYPVHNSVLTILQKESGLGLKTLVPYQKFSSNVKKSKQDLIAILSKAKKEKKRVTGYAATSKSTTVINYCGLSASDIEYLCDTTPLKQGKFSPGAHIPVISPDLFHQQPPDYAILFGWNHQTEIVENEKIFLDKGGKFIFFVPEVKIWP